MISKLAKYIEIYGPINLGSLKSIDDLLRCIVKVGDAFCEESTPTGILRRLPEQYTINLFFSHTCICHLSHLPSYGRLFIHWSNFDAYFASCKSRIE